MEFNNGARLIDLPNKAKIEYIDSFMNFVSQQYKVSSWR